MQQQKPKTKAGLFTCLFERAGTLINKLDDLSHLVEGMNLSLAFPQIIVVGEESSGKSSVLERMAMLPLFPRGEELTTRMPIKLQLRHLSLPQMEEFCKQNGLTFVPHRAYARAKGTTAEGKEVWGSFFGMENIEENMRNVMNENVMNKNGGVNGIIRDILTVEITSNLVPNLNLIDLPGIVGARLPGEPIDMPQQTTDLVASFLQQPHTLVLAVVPAHHYIRNSRGMGLIQQYHKEKDTLGVLTMADKGVDYTDPTDKYRQLKKKMMGIAHDSPFLDHGYVAVKNRDTRVEGQTLQSASEDEEAWFNKHTPGFIEKGVASSAVLLDKLVQLLIDYVERTWVPLIKQQLEDEQKRTLRDMDSLGLLPTDLNSFLVDVVTKLLQRRLDRSFASHASDSLLRTIEKNISAYFDKAANSPTKIPAEVSALSLLKQVEKDSWFVSVLPSTVKAALKAAKVLLTEDCKSAFSDFSSGTDDPRLKFKRFAYLQGQMVAIFEKMFDDGLEKANSKISAELGVLFSQSRSESPYQDSRPILSKKISNLCFRAVLEEMVLPTVLKDNLSKDVLQKLVMTSTVTKLLKEDPETEQARERLRMRVENIKAVLAELQAL